MFRCVHGEDSGKQQGGGVGASTATKYASSALQVCPSICDKKSKMQYRSAEQMLCLHVALAGNNQSQTSVVSGFMHTCSGRRESMALYFCTWFSHGIMGGEERRREQDAAAKTVGET